MEEYLKDLMNLLEPSRKQIFSYFDQQALSRLMCAMTQVEDSEEATICRNYITKFSKQRSHALSNVHGMCWAGFADFEKQEPNFICLPKVPSSQVSVGPRAIDNRPAWLTEHMTGDFICIQQSAIPYGVQWLNREWGIPRRPYPPHPINGGAGPQPHIKAYVAQHSNNTA